MMIRIKVRELPPGTYGPRFVIEASRPAPKHGTFTWRIGPRFWTKGAAHQLARMVRADLNGRPLA